MATLCTYPLVFHLLFHPPLKIKVNNGGLLSSSSLSWSSSRKRSKLVDGINFYSKSMDMGSPFFLLRSQALPAGNSNMYSALGASKHPGQLKPDDEKKEGAEELSSSEDEDPFVMDQEERQELRRKIREVIDMNPEVEEETDPVEKRKKMDKLLAEYPLVVEEDDPDWPEDADGWGFNLDQFFNKITIKNVKKRGDDDNDDNYDSENEVVWQDDDYIRPIKDITTSEWEETVFKDISPLVVLVHNRYRRPKENEKVREELEKAIHIIWNCRLPSPRCVAIDAVIEVDLVSSLGVSIFPQLIFTKSGKILHREKEIRTADELSKIMAFFYYGAAKPSCLTSIESNEDAIPTVSISS